MSVHCGEMKSVWVPFKETTSLWAPQQSHNSGESVLCVNYFSWIVSLLYFPFTAKPCLHLLLAVLISHSKRILSKPKNNKQKCILVNQHKAISHQIDLLDSALCSTYSNIKSYFLLYRKEGSVQTKGFHFRNREYQREFTNSVCRLNSAIKISQHK